MFDGKWKMGKIVLKYLDTKSKELTDNTIIIFISSIQNQVSRIKYPESSIQNQVSRIKHPESSIQNQESRIFFQELSSNEVI